MSEISPKNLERYAQTVTTGARKVGSREMTKNSRISLSTPYALLDPDTSARATSEIMARHRPHPIASMARAAVVVLLMVAGVLPAAAGDAHTGERVPVTKPPRRASHGGRLLLAAPYDVQPSAGFEDEYSPAASLDADASASVEDSASVDAGDGAATEDGPEKMKSPSVAVPIGETENATAGTGDDDDATGASSASVDASEEKESKALVVVDADPVRRVTAKTKPSAAEADAEADAEASAPAPGADETGDADVADAPGPAQELSSDEETPAEAPEESHVNTTSEVLAPAPAPLTATEDTPAADAPAESGLEPAADAEGRGNATAGDAESDEESSDAGDAAPAVEKKHEKKRKTIGDETGHAGGVEEEDDAPAPAPEETAEEDSNEEDADALAASQDPAPEPEEEDLLAPETPSPPPPVAGTISGYADDADSDVARAGRQDSREEVTPSWREAAPTPNARGERGGSTGAVQLEVAVGNPESGESEFERAVPIVLGGCALFVVGAVVYSRTRRARGKTRGPASVAKTAPKAGGGGDWNENWSDDDEEGGWSDGERGKRRGSPISAEKWAAEEPAWSDDEEHVRDGDGDGWR